MEDNNDEITKFHEDGYMVLKDIIPQDVIQEALAVATTNFNDCLSLISERNLEFGMHAKKGFKEIVQRNQSRYEMTYGMDDSPIFQSPRIMDNEKLNNVLDGIFGIHENPTKGDNDDGCDDKRNGGNRTWKLCSRSIVMAQPGALEQQWHVDGAHVDIKTHRPCHVLNVGLDLIL